MVFTKNKYRPVEYSRWLKMSDYWRDLIWYKCFSLWWESDSLINVSEKIDCEDEIKFRSLLHTICKN